MDFNTKQANALKENKFQSMGIEIQFSSLE